MRILRQYRQREGYDAQLLSYEDEETFVKAFSMLKQVQRYHLLSVPALHNAFGGIHLGFFHNARRLSTHLRESKALYKHACGTLLSVEVVCSIISNRSVTTFFSVVENCMLLS